MVQGVKRIQADQTMLTQMKPPLYGIGWATILNHEAHPLRLSQLTLLVRGLPLCKGLKWLRQDSCNGQRTTGIIFIKS